MSQHLVPLDYTSKDYDGFRSSMLEYASLTYPAWTGRSEADFGVTLVELFAYMGDILSYYGDRAARESFITTATQRSSLLGHAYLLGYSPFGYIASTGTVTFTTDVGRATSVLIPAGTQVATDFIDAYDASIIYETNAAVTVPATGGSIGAAVTQGIRQGSTTKILNAGAASQANILVVQLGTGDGTLDQDYRLPDSPAIQGSLRVFVDDVLSNNTSAIVEWMSVEALLSAGPTDSVFSTYLDSANVSHVRLGDNLNGAAPAVGVRIYATYRVGAGTRGNVEAGRITSLVAPVVGVTITGSSVTTGGSNAESNDSIRSNAPKAFRVQNRAVTLQDYADLATVVPGVSKAKAIGAASTSITVFIVGPTGATPTTSLLTATQASLAAKASAGATVTVSAGTKIFVNIGAVATPMRVGVYPHFSTLDVQAAVESAVFDTLSSDNTSLGQRLGASTIYAAAQAVPGVAYVVIPLMARSTDPQTGVNDILCRDWEYPVIGTLSVSAEAAQN